MTVIAVRDGSMSCDSLITDGAERSGGVLKLRKTKRGIAGACGDVAVFAAWLDWFSRGEKGDPPSAEGMQALVVRPCGSVWCHEDDAAPYRVSGPYHAIGSGGPYALGAMAFGADARQAVRIAIELCTSCGGRIITRRLPDKSAAK